MLHTYMQRREGTEVEKNQNVFSFFQHRLYDSVVLNLCESQIFVAESERCFHLRIITILGTSDY